jgi:hypothetical protein
LGPTACRKSGAANIKTNRDGITKAFNNAKERKVYGEIEAEERAKRDLP